MSYYLEGLFFFEKSKIAFLKIAKKNKTQIRMVLHETGRDRSGFRVEKRTYYVLKKHSAFRYTMVTARATPQTGRSPEL